MSQRYEFVLMASQEGWKIEDRKIEDRKIGVWSSIFNFINTLPATFLEKVAQKAAFRESLTAPGFLPP